MGALTDISAYLVQTVLSLYMVAMLLRFLLQLVRADFYNPISQFLVKVTNPLVLPLRKMIPGLGGLDLATLLLSLLLQILLIVAVLMLNGWQLPHPVQLMLWAALGLVGLLVKIYFFALLAMIILSWVAPGTNNPAVYLLHQITEPVMAPVRKIMPPMGGMDFSPIVVFVLINIIEIALGHMAAAIHLPAGLAVGL